MIQKLKCGCEVADDGFRYTCCKQHADLNPCMRYWPPETQEKTRVGAALARKLANLGAPLTVVLHDNEEWRA